MFRCSIFIFYTLILYVRARLRVTLTFVCIYNNARLYAYCTLFGMKNAQFDLMADRLGSISRSMTCGPTWPCVDIFRIVHTLSTLIRYSLSPKKADNPRYARPGTRVSLSHAPVTSASNRVARQA